MYGVRVWHPADLTVLELSVWTGMKTLIDQQRASRGGPGGVLD